MHSTERVQVWSLAVAAGSYAAGVVKAGVSTHLWLADYNCPSRRGGERDTVAPTSRGLVGLRIKTMQIKWISMSCC